jgi:transcriptional regulator with GAF, ATPase, and Fis domain
MKHRWRCRRGPSEHAVEHERVYVDVQIQSTSEALDHGDRAALAVADTVGELFGHERGAFTGAIERRLGLLSVADGGTVFLDEVGELSPDAQVMLLRFLANGEIRPVGSTRTTQVDVRVIAATHRNLEDASRQGAFREDLYYRLRRVVFDIPPLRARPDDIPLLIEHFRCA